MIDGADLNTQLFPQKPPSPSPVNGSGLRKPELDVLQPSIVETDFYDGDSSVQNINSRDTTQAVMETRMWGEVNKIKRAIERQREETDGAGSRQESRNKKRFVVESMPLTGIGMHLRQNDISAASMSS